VAGLTFINQVGAVEGMNQAAPGTLIPESFVRWSQDVLFDRAGLMRRRGPFTKFATYQEASPNIRTEYDPTSNSTSNERVLSIFSTYTPDGDVRIGMLVHITTDAGVLSAVLRVFDSYFVYLGEETLPFTPNILSIVSTKPALGGGLWVSISENPANSETHYQFFWRGGVSTVTTTGTFTLTSSLLPGFTSSSHGTINKEINSVGALSSVFKGMFVYVRLGSSPSYTYHYIGTVKSVTNTQVILEKYPFIWDSVVDSNEVAAGTGHVGSMSLSGVSLYFTSIRPFEHVHGRGLITTTYNSQNIATGTVGTSADGHWVSAGIAGWYLYRASDNAFIGKVQTITTNANGSLHVHPGVTIAADEYIMKPFGASTITGSETAYKISTRFATSFGGLYTAVYAGYQWYGNFAKDDANTNRIVFSATHDREAVDLSRDAADSIIFPGKSKFRGLGASNAGLLVFLEDRTYILRGNDRTNFSVEQLVPEGCLCPTSIVEYGGGVFWAGKSGIMFFDGASVRNLTKDNLGLYYTDSLDEFDSEQDRVIGFMHKNNLIMHYTSWKSPFDPIRYEPLYADDWQNAPGKYGKETYEQFDPDFALEDFTTNNNTPIFWDQKKLNNPEESASTGKAITWQSGFYAKNVAGSTVPTTFDVNYIYMPDLTAANRFRKWNGTSYAIVTPVAAIGSTAATKLYVYTGTSFTTATIIIWNGSAWISSASSDVLWSVGTSLNKWGPLRQNTSITFCYYTPTGSITTLSNMDFRGVTSAETILGLKTILGVNSIESGKYRARFIDIHPVFDTNTNGIDSFLVEKPNIPAVDLVRGPDFYLQTKHFTVGDPILRKWFQRIMLSMLLYDGAVRIDLIDDDDNDEVDINKKKHKYWEVFTEKGYDWDYLGAGEGANFGVVFPKLTSPSISSWQNVEGTVTLWDELFTSDFNRYSKRVSWRKTSVGFRLYQLNNYKKPFNGVVTIPNRVELQGFSIGFKPLRQGRV
jgi:hypothetical protein